MDNTCNTRRAILFARTADDDLRDFRLAEQMKDLHEHARLWNFHIVGSVTCVGSADQRFLSDLLHRKREVDDFDIIIATEWSRFTRKTFCHVRYLMHQFKSVGVSLQTITGIEDGLWAIGDAIKLQVPLRPNLQQKVSSHAYWKWKKGNGASTSNNRVEGGSQDTDAG